MYLCQARHTRVPAHVILNAEQWANPQNVKTASTLSWTKASLRFHYDCWYFHVWWRLWSVQLSVNLNCSINELRIAFGFGLVRSHHAAFDRLAFGLQISPAWTIPLILHLGRKPYLKHLNQNTERQAGHPNDTRQKNDHLSMRKW